jgi:hypothetical protein
MENNAASTLRVGNFKQKANWFLVGFVFGCIFVIILLLFILQKSEAAADELNSITRYGEEVSY